MKDIDIEVVHDSVELFEHDVVIRANTLRLKIIGEAISEYLDRNVLEDTTLSDLAYKCSCNYQETRKLGIDDWNYIQIDKDYLGMLT